MSVSMTAGAKGIAVTEPEQILSALSSESATALWSLKMRGCRCAGTCPKCQEAAKQSQIAALRVRLGDIAAGASGFGIYNSSNTQMAISWAIMELFKVPVCYTKCSNLDSLAAWLWERGVRA